MTMPSESKMRGPVRRRIFAGWVAVTCVIAAYTGFAGPLVPFVDAEYSWVAAVVPPIMILLTLTVVGWLALFVAAAPDRNRDR